MNSSVFVKKEILAAEDTDVSTNQTVEITPIGMSGDSSSYSSSKSSNVNDPNSNVDDNDALLDSITKLKNLQERLNNYKRKLNVCEEISSQTKRPQSEHLETAPSLLGFLQPLPPMNFSFTPVALEVAPISQRFADNYNNEIYNNNRHNGSSEGADNVVVQSCKQFWKAGDYEGPNAENSNSALSSGKLLQIFFFGCNFFLFHTLYYIIYFAVGMDHVRVHPRFLHSNATSHKWALGGISITFSNGIIDYMNFGYKIYNTWNLLASILFCSFRWASWQFFRRGAWFFSFLSFNFYLKKIKIHVVLELCLNIFNLLINVGQVCNGATFVNVDMIHNGKDGSNMLLVDGMSFYIFNYVINYYLERMKDGGQLICMFIIFNCR